MSYDLITQGVLQLSYEDKINLLSFIANTLKQTSPQIKEKNLSQFFGTNKEIQDPLAIQKELRNEWQ